MLVHLTLFLSLALTASALAEPIERERIKVVDGDTVRVDGVRMRVFGCDAPETTDSEARCDVEREWGKRAADRLNSILDAGKIDVDVRKRRDRYRRPLVRITVDGTDVCTTMISERLAVRYRGRGPRMDWCPKAGGVRRPAARQ